MELISLNYITNQFFNFSISSIKKINSDAKKSSVMCLFLENNNKVYILLTKRSNNLSNHAGEICFPGGGEEKADNDLVETALRETFEAVVWQNEEINVNAPIEIMPINCIFICENLSRPVSKILKSLNKPTANVPQTPAAKWTGTAPTTSSISNLFNTSFTIIAIIAPTIPTKIEVTEVIELHPAVIATKPASGPKMI